VDRKPSTDSEDVNRNQKRIKIEGFAMAKGMQFVGRALAAFQAENQEQLISRVHGGMKRLGHHGGAACQEGCNVLAGSDSEVRDNGNINNFFGGTRSHVLRTLNEKGKMPGVRFSALQPWIASF
jgi:hypothetical protein